jgi:hypothetical protein
MAMKKIIICSRCGDPVNWIGITQDEATTYARDLSVAIREEVEVEYIGSCLAFKRTGKVIAVYRRKR